MRGVPFHLSHVTFPTGIPFPWTSLCIGDRLRIASLSSDRAIMLIKHVRLNKIL